ncbi:RNA polymerase sigma factor [Ruminococcus sp. 5_1_39BFAA]|uniref:RNA polymerase sigma factor n=1 Tax=Ruminococcus sp. 5_1_39BFAA TaxID=457412 RepID=UPI0035679B1B
MTKEKFMAEVRASETMLYHVAKSVLKSDADCADAVQEALLIAYEKKNTLKKERFFQTWLTRILINECYKICNRNKIIVPYEDYMQSGRIEEKKYSSLYQAVLDLPEELRILVTLYYLEGFSQKEISKILEMREGTIKSRLSRARKILREKLEGEEETLC